MKIKLALLDNDQNYLNRIVSVFNIRYADKLEFILLQRLRAHYLHLKVLALMFLFRVLLSM